MPRPQPFDEGLLEVISKVDYDEPFDVYYRRVEPHLIGFPKEVVSEWLYRHDNFISRFGHHDLSQWSFEEAMFTTQEILEVELFPSKKASVIDVGNHIFREQWIRESEPALSLRNTGTFPSPIILFKNAQKYFDHSGENYLGPYHLAEGHKRWGYINAITNCPERCELTKPLNAEHKVYLLKMNGDV
ncbi:MAG: hypothetical protein HWE26_18605 [Alteromonadaceae bacterium]|nr:hypothetical protein [Alteromonadaceae bacterium]